MKHILISWIGGNDLNSLNSEQQGPILTALQAQSFDQLELLYNYPKSSVQPYIQYLEDVVGVSVSAYEEKLTSPIDFGDIYTAANNRLQSLFSDGNNQVSILLSPGTPAMQAVWILLGKTRYPVVFYQSSLEQGLQKVEIPFDISAEFLPELAINTDHQLTRIASGQVPVNAAFDDIVTQNPIMLSLKEQANVIAQRDIPVLIYGETGTGKELFATAIHNASLRKESAFVSVNCGAIPDDLIDSTLFGYKKGAFTGANQDKAGLFQQADGGTIFLDEFGELSKAAQVRLLRVLQNGEVQPVGASGLSHVNVRVIVATNRNLMEEVSDGRFREDLFYRIAVGVLHLPPLRERAGDIGLLVDTLMGLINEEASAQPAYKQKNISIKGRNILLSHAWRGNIRELYSTLLRASLWAKASEVTENDIQTALFEMPEKSTDIMGRELNKGFNIQLVMGEVARCYIGRALTESNGNKTQAAEKLGLASYQTLKSWIEKYGLTNKQE